MEPRCKQYEPQQNVFINFDPAEIFPSGTFERFLVDTIDEMDLSCFNKQEDKGGKTPYDPRAMLGIIFYSYCNGCFSARKMEKNCQKNMGYMFVSGHNTPEHTTISRFLIKYEKEIIELFSKILYIADQKKYINYDLIAIDGTKIKANASERFIGTVEDFEKKKDKLAEKIAEAVKKQKLAEADNIKEYWTKKEEVFKKDQKKITEFLKDAQKIMTKENKESKQNINDTDSRILKFKRKIFASGYNAQAASCDESGIIITTEVTNKVSDTENFSPMLKKIEADVPGEAKEKLKDSKFLFDNGYHSTDNVIEADKNEFDVYIAEGQAKDLFKEDKDKKKTEEKCIGSKHCTISKNPDGKVVLTCPGNKSFIDYQVGKKEDRILYRYIVDECDICRCCKDYDICVGKYKNSRQRKEFKIDSKKIDYYEVLERHTEKLNSEKGKMIYSRRMPTIERVFAYIKGKLGLTSFSRKGLQKVKVEWALGCMAHNLVRMFNLQVTKT